MKRSIKLHLNLFFAILLLLFAFYSLVLYMVVERALLASVDRHIADDARIFEQSYFLGKDFEPRPGYELYAIRTPDGSLLEASEDISLPFSKDWTTPDLRLIKVGDRFYRMLTYKRKDGFYVQYAVNFTSEKEFLERLKVFLFLSWLSFLLILAGIYLFTVRSLLNSIKRASDSLFEERFDEKVYEELKPFMEKVYEGIKRIRESAERHRKILLALSHSVKTPLSTALLLLEDLMRSHKDDRLKTIHEELWRLERSLSTFLRMAKMESQQDLIKKERCNLEEVLKGIVRLYDPEGKRIRLSLLEEPLCAYCDRDVLLEVLGVLVDNAIRHGIEEGKVDIRVEKDGEYAYVKVSNLSEKPVEDRVLFKPFEGRHTGIGLYVAYNLCKMMGCDLKIGQERVEEGYRVEASLRLSLC